MYHIIRAQAMGNKKQVIYQFLHIKPLFMFHVPDKFTIDSVHTMPYPQGRAYI